MVYLYEVSLDRRPRSLVAYAAALPSAYGVLPEREQILEDDESLPVDGIPGDDEPLPPSAAAAAGQMAQGQVQGGQGTTTTKSGGGRAKRGGGRKGGPGAASSSSAAAAASVCGVLTDRLWGEKRKVKIRDPASLVMYCCGSGA